jgi:hypothetical protein
VAAADKIDTADTRADPATQYASGQRSAQAPSAFASELLAAALIGSPAPRWPICGNSSASSEATERIRISTPLLR